MTAALISQVAIALLTGATLIAPRSSVGPYRLATDGADVMRFACLDLQGGVIPATEAHDEIVSPWPRDRMGVHHKRATRHTPDFSAFAAARCFVEREALESVVGALRDLEKNRLVGTNAGHCDEPIAQERAS